MIVDLLFPHIQMALWYNHPTYGQYNSPSTLDNLNIHTLMGHQCIPLFYIDYFSKNIRFNL